MEQIQIIGLSLLTFTSIILLLVVVITTLETKLVPQGMIQIKINEASSGKAVDARPGASLLSALAEAGIYLPSACGGGGTCAMCRCQIVAGGGEILPTEKGAFSRKEIKDNWRLSCQVKLKNDLGIKVPDEIFNIQKFECIVVANDNVATFIKDLVLKIEGGAHLHFEAGGYIQIYIPPYKLNYKEFAIADKFKGDWDKFNLWQYNAKNDEEIFRAYSMANHPAEGDIVKLNVRIASPPPGQDVPPGIASSYIFSLKPGDRVTVSGPYGEFFIKDTDREMVYIGGGAGMAPLRSHIFHLFHTLETGRKVTYFYGARSKREMFYEDEFREIEKKFPNFKFHVAFSDPLPEDNWSGYKGFIHNVVYNEYLKNHEDPAEIEYYMCGPPMMTSSVLKMLDDLGVSKEMIAFDDFGG